MTVPQSTSPVTPPESRPLRVAVRKKAVAKRRMAADRSKTRAQLIEAAGRLLSKEGYAAVTARRLAEEMGIKRQTVHYYFSTIDAAQLTVRPPSDKSCCATLRFPCSWPQGEP